MSINKPTILCIASFFKGNDFIRECKKNGAGVVLLTKEKLANAEWAFESLDDLISIPGKISDQSYLAAAIHVLRHHRVSRVVALEEFDVVTAALIREQLSIPGMGTTTARSFQDKLAMRVRAREVNIQQPDFVPLLNSEAIEQFMRRTRAPWMLKPRLGASSMGIRKLNNAESAWQALVEIDARKVFEETAPFHLLEHYIPGEVFHVDSLVLGGKILFASVAHYCSPPFEVSQHGGVNMSHTVRHGSPDEKSLLEINQRVLERFKFEWGVTHAEFVRGGPEDQFYFLEVAARVGGAYTADMIEAATGINVWREWARIELATPERPYSLPPIRQDYGGIAVSLARQEKPSTEAYIDPEIVFRVAKPWHVGLIVQSHDYERVIQLLDSYRQRFHEDFTAVLPLEEKPLQYL